MSFYFNSELEEKWVGWNPKGLRKLYTWSYLVLFWETFIKCFGFFYDFKLKYPLKSLFSDETASWRCWEHTGIAAPTGNWSHSKVRFMFSHRGTPKCKVKLSEIPIKTHFLLMSLSPTATTKIGTPPRSWCRVPLTTFAFCKGDTLVMRGKLREREGGDWSWREHLQCPTFPLWQKLLKKKKSFKGESLMYQHKKE